MPGGSAQGLGSPQAMRSQSGTGYPTPGSAESARRAPGGLGRVRPVCAPKHPLLLAAVAVLAALAILAVLAIPAAPRIGGRGQRVCKNGRPPLKPLPVPPGGASMSGRCFKRPDGAGGAAPGGAGTGNLGFGVKSPRTSTDGEDTLSIVISESTSCGPQTARAGRHWPQRQAAVRAMGVNNWPAGSI